MLIPALTRFASLQRQAAVVLLLGLSACATLPSSGPTGHQIVNAGKDKRETLPFPLVELDTLAAIPAPDTGSMALPPVPAPPTDLIGSGDVLGISIYEAGVALFGVGNLRTGGTGAGGADGGLTAPLNTSAQTERLPPIRVDDEGNIRLPFAGTIHAAGTTTAQLQALIRRAYRGLSQNPQIVVTIDQAITNSVIVGGDVNRSGRLVLSTNRETLSDVIALAGGYRGEARDLVARVERAGQTYDVRVGDLLSGLASDSAISPGDRVTIVSAPQSFSVMGGSNRVDELRFPRATVTLAQAVALAGGSNPDRGDPAAIFVFRFVRREDGTEQPLVYHLNMMRAGGYLISQRFAMRDKDVLYIGNARANQPTKLIQILSQLFQPLVTVRQTVR